MIGVKEQISDKVLIQITNHRSLLQIPIHPRYAVMTHVRDKVWKQLWGQLGFQTYSQVREQLK